MTMPIRFLRLLIAPALLAASGLAAAAAPKAFTATYEVLRGGSAIGRSTLTLRADGPATWTYASNMEGTSGLAALLGADVRETSRFRWKDGRPEALSYDYKLDAAIKSKQRHLRVDWKADRVDVDDGRKGTFRYAPKPGLVERHSLPLALAWALQDGKRTIALPVAVQDRVQTQRFEVTGDETVKVPAGTFHALRVDRTDDNKSFSAWFAPDRFPVPVKLAQSDGGDITMLLKSFKRP